jgi:membrane protease YdiL (CAAX protease family)
MNRRLGVALVAFVVWTAVTVIGGNMTTGGEASLLDAVTSGLGWTWLIAAAFILSVVLWQGWRDVALDRWTDAAGWRLAWLPMIYIVGGFAVATFLGLPPATVLLLLLLNTFLVGFSEEVMFRGVLLQAFRHATAIWPAVLLTSVAFGAVHSLNVFVTGDLRAALIQSSAAFLSGLMFIALRLRTGSLWPPIIVHALWDFATFTLGAAGAAAAHDGLPSEAATPAGATGLVEFLPVLLVLPNAIYGLWLMRDIRRTHAAPDA